MTLTEEPNLASDPNSLGLLAVLQETENRFEDVFENANQTIRITYLWDLATPGTGQAPPNWVVEDGSGQITHAIVRFDPTRNWFIDPTPANDSEFTMAQKLYSYGSNTLSGAERLANFSETIPGTIPDVFEAGYFGPANANGPASPEVDGGNVQRDLLTVAFQEVGHAIGVSSGFPGNIVTDPNGIPLSGEAADGDWDVDPDFVDGVAMAMLAPGVGSGPFAHLVGSDAVLSVGLGSVDMRTRPSAADYFAIAATQGWTAIDLPRQDFLSGSDWNTAGNWMGNQVPGSTDAAYVRHGGDVDLSGNASVRNLLVDEQSSVSTSLNTLHVFDTTTVGGSAGGVSVLTVFPIGILQTNVLEINDEGRTRVDFGGLVDASTLNINDGGELWLAGTPSSAAVVDGIITLVNSGGLLRVTGNSQVDSQLALNSMGVVDVQDPGVELRLNWITGLNGGMIQGAGVVRQNGAVFVTDDTTININIYDMDGQNGDTVITIESDNTLDINSPNIDTSPANDFDGTLEVNGGTLRMAPDWILDGTLNLTQDGSTAVLTGPGRLTVSTTGLINVSGAGRIESDVTLAGELFVAGEADFNGNTIVTATAELETDGPNDVIDFNGPTILGGGSYVGGGVIRFDGDIQIIGNTAVGMGQADLDGDNAFGSISIAPGVTFSVASGTLDPSDDAYDAVMNVRGTFSSIVPFQLDGTLNLIQDTGRGVPQINGLTGFVVRTSGTVNTDGDALINRNTTLQGNLNVGTGVTQINGTSSFESTATVTVASGGELELNGVTTFLGGSYTGAGLIRLNATTMIDSATTVNTARIDLDGAAENTIINVNDVAFSLNVETVDATNNLFGGTMNVAGENAVLDVNMTNFFTAWRLSSSGVLNFTNPAAGPVTMLTGSGLLAEGIINGTGRVALAVNMSVQNRLNSVTAASDVHFAGDGRTTVYQNPTATIAGLGSITIDNGTTVNLENATLIAVDTENVGRLEIGFEASEVAIDYIVPAMATIRGTFSQATVGELAVDLGGLQQSTEYDWLEVIGQARLNGTIEVQLIDGFLPKVGHTFQVLTATSVVGTFDQIVTIDETNMFDFDITAIYSNTDVVLRIDDIFLSADFDRDDDVDGNDFLILQAGLGLTMQVDNTNGDATGDGLVNSEDISIWENQYGSMFSPLVAAATVPEPSGCVLLILGVIGLCRPRKCR